jgi:hypothetical protein
MTMPKLYAKGFVEGALYVIAVYFITDHPDVIGDWLRKLARMVDGRKYVQADAWVYKVETEPESVPEDAH